MSDEAMDFEDWHALHEQDLVCEAAETGMDREGDFDMETFIEKRYYQYVEEHKTKQPTT